MSEYYRKYYADAVARGLCTKCRRPAVPGKNQCPACARKHRDREALRKATFTEAGSVTCVRCGDLIVGYPSEVVSREFCGIPCATRANGEKRALPVSPCRTCHSPCPRPGMSFCSRDCWRSGNGLNHRPTKKFRCIACGGEICDYSRDRKVCSAKCNGLARSRKVEILGVPLTARELAGLAGTTVRQMTTRIMNDRPVPTLLSPIKRQRSRTAKNRIVTDQQVAEMFSAKEAGESIRSVSRRLGIKYSTAYGWFWKRSQQGSGAQ